MIPKKTIEKAIEGGYTKFDFVLMKKPAFVTIKGDRIVAHNSEGGWETKSYIKISDALADWHRIALDPSFWQALGKALGWPPENFDTQKNPEYSHIKIGEWQEQNPNARYVQFCKLVWRGDTQKFWDELLTV